MRAEEVKAVLESIGKRPNRRVGQNFLLDEAIIESQVALAELSPEDTVLEIGPGLGGLTVHLLKTRARVVAVEQDPAFCQFLRKRFGERIVLIQADAVKAFLPKFNKVVSNLPYQISSPIIFKLLDIGFEVAVVMLQREFAERMVAKPRTSEYGRLSVGVYYRSDCKIVSKVPRTAFWPQPKVDSCMVRMKPRPPPFKVRDERIFFDVTKAIFSHRRKKIANTLLVDPVVASLLGSRDGEVISGLPYASRRAEELAPEMIGELADAVVSLSASSSSSQGRTSR